LKGHSVRPRTLIIMIKEPQPGQVKTRLGRDIGMVQSAWWFRHQARDLIARLRDPRWHVILAVSPDRKGLASRVWPTDLVRIPQGRGNLGDRMKRLLRLPFYGPVCLIGSDIPGVTRHRVWDAFRALGEAEIVVGPSPDGGYWLIGSRGGQGLPPSVFSDVRWSTCHALSDTVATLPGRKLARVACLQDVDRVCDLRTVKELSKAMNEYRFIRA